MTSIPTSRAQVLLVDDDAQQVILLSRWLEQTGHYEVSTASDGALGWNLIDAKPWSLIVSDIVMPELDGLSLLERVRRTDDRTPFLFVSGQSSADHAHRAVRLRANDFLVKPLGRDGFLSAVQALVGTYRNMVDRRSASVAAGTVRQAHRLLTEGRELIHSMANQMTPLIAAADLLSIETARPAPNLATCREYSRRVSDASEATLHALQRLRQLLIHPTLDRGSWDLTLAIQSATLLAAPALGARDVALTLNLPPDAITHMGNRTGIRELINSVLLVLAEDSSLLQLLRLDVTLSRRAYGPTLCIQLECDLAKLAEHDLVATLMDIFEPAALCLNVEIESRPVESGFLITLTFPDTEHALRTISSPSALRLPG